MPRAATGLEVVHAIICDEIRLENSGKLFLIGVFPTGMTVHAKPAMVPIDLWLHFRCLKKALYDLDLAIKGDGLEEEISLQVGFDARIVEEGYMPLILKKIPLKIKESGEVSILWRVSGAAKWITARKFAIICKPEDQEQKQQEMVRLTNKKKGPKPDTLKIEGDWEDAIDTALKKKRPVDGWPKEPKEKPKGE